MNPRNFFGELKRRNVYKVAVAYAVVSWLLIQIATQVFPFFEIPNWAVRLVVLLLILGFPVALILSWAFEITPEGIKREKDVAPNQSITHHTGRKIVGVTIVLAVIAAGMFVFQFLAPKTGITSRPASDSLRRGEQSEVAKEDGHRSATSLPIPEKSVAVLPFHNLSDEKQNAYFAEGIQDEILTRLAKIGALKVISRTSTSHYASSPENLPEIARQLGVANILEGSVQKIANSVHVNVQLIRAATDEHLWAESYNRKLDDVFAVEGEVATAIAEQLNAKLTGAEQKAVTDKPTQNPAAYDAYLRGISVEQSRNDDAAVEDARRNYEKAIEIDPKFALAWARLAVSRSRAYFNADNPTVNTAASVKEAADQALHLQPELGEAFVAQGAYRYRVLRDYHGALDAYSEAVKRLPNNAYVMEQMAHVERRLGQWDTSEKHYRAALQLDPRNMDYLGSLADILTALRKFPEALEIRDRMLEISPGSDLEIANKAYLFQLQGQLDQSARELAKIRSDSREIWVNVVKELQLEFEHRLDEVITFVQTSGIREFADDPRTLTILGMNQLWAGRKEDSRATLARAVATMKPSPDAVVPVDSRNLPAFLAWAYAGLGEKEKALEQGNRAVADYKNDALDIQFARQMLAAVQTQFGDSDAAIANITVQLEAPGGLTRGLLRIDPIWDPLRKDPRFQKLCQESPQ